VHDKNTEGARDGWGPNGIQLVASMAEQGVEASVMVTVPGGLIAGITISEKCYFAGLGDAYRRVGAEAPLASLTSEPPPVPCPDGGSLLTPPAEHHPSALHFPVVHSAPPSLPDAGPPPRCWR
jgi:hypothetical protein